MNVSISHCLLQADHSLILQKWGQVFQINRDLQLKNDFCFVFWNQLCSAFGIQFLVLFSNLSCKLRVYGKLGVRVVLLDWFPIKARYPTIYCCSEKRWGHVFSKGIRVKWIQSVSYGIWTCFLFVWLFLLLSRAIHFGSCKPYLLLIWWTP